MFNTALQEEKKTLLAQIDGRISFEIEGRRRRRWAIDVAFGRVDLIDGGGTRIGALTGALVPGCVSGR